MKSALSTTYDNTQNRVQSPLPIIDKSYNLSEAFEYCEAINKNHYENFPVASLLVPKKLRRYINTVYAFARIADDFADEKEFDGARMEKLVDWELKLRSMSSHKPTHPVFIALKETVLRFRIPLSLFENLLTAFKMDVVVKRYQNFDQVLGYCRYSANPVGRIILYLFGYPAPKFLEYSDYICTALQLTNFWQDIAIDLEKDRIYIPLEDLNRFGYTETELKEKIYNDNFKRLLFFQLEKTQELFERGKALCGKIPGRLGLELKMTWLGGTTILKKMSNESNVFLNRPVLKKKNLLGLFIKSLNRKNFTVKDS